MLLYAVTDSSWLNGRSLAQDVEDVLKAGATFIQLREKNADYDQMLKLAKEIKALTDKYNVPFVIDDNIDAVSYTHLNLFKEFSESIKSRMEKGYILPEMANVIYDYTASVKMAENYCEVIMSSIAGSLPDFNIKSIVDFSVRSTESFNNKVEYFADEVKRLKESGYCVLILSSAESRGERIVRELYDFGIEAAFVLNPWEVDLKAGTVTVSRGNLGRGFIYNDIKFVVFSDNEFFDEKKGKKARKKKKNTKTIESFSDLKPGDYVVHSSHGIGVYRGIEKITVDGVNKDYVKVSYADGGNLFIPAGQMDCIQKYIGSDGIKVKLNKLGGQDWNKTKAKVRKSVEILAEDLVKLYAKRQAAKGFVYSPDNIWQREFEEMFPYDETDDQLNAIDEVKHDMETGRVMDRHRRAGKHANGRACVSV